MHQVVNATDGTLTSVTDSNGQTVNYAVNDKLLSNFLSEYPLLASFVPLVIAAFVVVILSTTMSFTILANHHGTAFTTKELRCQQILFCCLEAWRRKSVMRFTLLHSVE